MPSYLRLGSAVLAGFLASYCAQPAKQPSLEFGSTQYASANPEFNLLYTRIQSLEDIFYSSSFDADKAGTEETKVNRKIAWAAEDDISQYMKKLGIQDRYIVIAAFTYRGNVIFDAREVGTSDPVERWIKIGSNGVDIAKYKSSEGLPSILDSGNLERPPNFEKILEDVKYANSELEKMKERTYSSSRPQYAYSVKMDLALQIAKKCGLETFMDFAPSDIYASGSDAIKIDAGRLVFYSDVGHWEPSDLIISRDGKATLSIPVGYGNFRTTVLDCML